MVNMSVNWFFCSEVSIETRVVEIRRLTSTTKIIDKKRQKQEDSTLILDTLIPPPSRTTVRALNATAKTAQIGRDMAKKYVHRGYTDRVIWGGGELNWKIH